RGENDTFPTYVSFNLQTNQVGTMATGFLPPQYSVFDINPQEAANGMALDAKAVELLEERWRLLAQLRDTQRERMKGYGREVGAFEDFSEIGKRMLTDPRWPAAFQVSAEDRKRYGDNAVGLSC